MTTRRGPIVVGIDGSAHLAASVAAAIELGARHAARRDADLRLVYGYGTPSPIRDDADTRGDAARHVLDRSIAHAAAAYPQLSIGGAVYPGSTAKMLVAASTEAALVLVCADARVHYGGLQAGLVSVQVAAHTRAPVIVVATPPSAGTAIDHDVVVVGVDGSPGSTGAVAYAFAEAHARGGRVHVRYVSERRQPVDLSSADDMLRATIAASLRNYPDTPVRLDAVGGDNPVRGLNDAGVHADLIVVGARGRGGFATLVLGSVSDGLVRYARTNVAVVPAGR